MKRSKVHSWNRTHRLGGVALVIGGRRVLGAGVLRALLVVLRIVLRAVLAILLWVITLLRFLSKEALLGRRRGILGYVTLLLVLCGMDKGHVGSCEPPPSVGGVSEEDRKDDHETGDRNADARSGAKLVPADELIESDSQVS